MGCKSFYYAASESECWLGVCLADDASAYSNQQLLLWQFSNRSGRAPGSQLSVPSVAVMCIRKQYDTLE